MKPYSFQTHDYEYLQNRFSDYGDDEMRFTGTIKPSGYQFKVKDIFHSLDNNPIGNDFVSYFGYYNWIFFVLTIHGDFIYAHDIQPTHDDIVLATDGRKTIDEDDIDVLSAYDYAFNFTLYAEEYIVIY